MNSLQRAYEYCEWITYHHYENFPVASWLLPKDKRPHIAAIYAFARSADDFADETKYRGRSLEMMEIWRSALWGRGRLTEHPIFIALANSIQECRLPVQLLDDLLTAFTMDVTKQRYANWNELMTYCRYSANPIGRLVLTVFGYHDPALHLLSDHICTGLQLANHWQDLSIDVLEKDRLYIPADFLRRYGVTVEDLQFARSRPLPPGFQDMMKELVSLAGQLFNAGEPLLEKVSGRLRVELKLTVLGGRAILNRISETQYDVFHRRPVLSMLAKAKLLTDAVCS